MNRRLAVCVVLLLPLAFSSPLSAADLDLSQHYLLLATKKTSTMQKELSEATAAGYRVLYGSPTSGTEVMLLLERVGESQSFEYELLATTRTSTMNEELKESAAKGFRAIPSTLLSKKGFMGSVEILVVMEKQSGDEGGPMEDVEYLLLATSRTGTLQKEMSEAWANGFRLLSIASSGEHIALLEKPKED